MNNKVYTHISRDANMHYIHTLFILNLVKTSLCSIQCIWRIKLYWSFTFNVNVKYSSEWLFVDEGDYDKWVCFREISLPDQ